MSKHAPSTLLKPIKDANQAGSGPAASTRAVLFGGAALLILFGWLHLILSLQIASTGRQIQVATEDLARVERDNLAIVRDIAVSEAEENMAARATALGYGPQAPLYLSLSRPVTASMSDTLPVASWSPTQSTLTHAGPSPVSQFLLPARPGTGMSASWP